MALNPGKDHSSPSSSKPSGNKNSGPAKTSGSSLSKDKHTGMSSIGGRKGSLMGGHRDNPSSRSKTKGKNGTEHITDGKGNAWSRDPRTGDWVQTKKRTALGGSMTTAAGARFAQNYGGEANRFNSLNTNFDKSFGRVSHAARFGVEPKAYEARGQFAELQKMATDAGMPLQDYVKQNNLGMDAMQAIQRDQIAGRTPNVVDVQIAHMGGQLSADEGASMMNRQVAASRGTLGDLWDGITQQKRQFSPSEFSKYAQQGAIGDIAQGFSEGLAKTNDQGVIEPDKWGMFTEAFGNILGPMALAGATGGLGNIIGGVGGQIVPAMGKAAASSMLDPRNISIGPGTAMKAYEAYGSSDPRLGLESLGEAIGGPLAGTLAGVSKVDRVNKALGTSPGYQDFGGPVGHDRPQGLPQQQRSLIAEREAENAYVDALLNPQRINPYAPTGLPQYQPAGYNKFFVPMSGQPLGLGSALV